MKIRNIKIFFVGILSLTMMSCLDQSITDYGDSPVLVQFENLSDTYNFIQGDGSNTTEVEIPVALIGGKNQPLDKAVSLSVGVAQSSEAKEGVDFTFVNGSDLTIPAGSLIAPLKISINKDAADPFDPKTLVLEIKNADLNISEKKSAEYVLQAVCNFNLDSFKGTYTVTDHINGGSYDATMEDGPDGTLILNNVWNRGGQAALQFSDDPVNPYITYRGEELGYVILVHDTYGDAWATDLSAIASTYNSCDNSMRIIFKLCVEAGCFGNEFDFSLVKKSE